MIGPRLEEVLLVAHARDVLVELGRPELAARVVANRGRWPMLPGGIPSGAGPDVVEAFHSAHVLRHPEATIVDGGISCSVCWDAYLERNP